MSSDIATVTITVNSVNDDPVLADIDAQQTNEDASLTITLFATDVEGDSLSFDVGSDNVNITTEILDDTLLVMTPSEAYYGTANISVTVQDALGGSDSETFVLTVNLVLDPPVIVGQDPDPLITNEDTPLEITFDHLLVTDEDNV